MIYCQEPCKMVPRNSSSGTASIAYFEELRENFNIVLSHNGLVQVGGLGLANYFWPGLPLEGLARNKGENAWTKVPTPVSIGFKSQAPFLE